MAKGSVKKNANGTWEFVVDVGTAGVRKQVRRRGFRKKNEAEAEMTRILAEVNAGDYVDPSKITVATYLTEWLESKAGNMSRLTIDSYRSYIDNHINPVIGTVALGKLAAPDITRLVTYLRNKETGKGAKLSDATVQRIFNVLVTALNGAVRSGHVKDNVAKLVDKPRVKRKTLDVWSVEDVTRFLSAMYDHRHYIVYHLAIMTGMRQGEILGLAWSGIDFGANKIRVTQTMSHDRKEINAGAKTLAGIRSISIDDKDIAELRRHLHRVEEEREAAGDMYEDNGLVVCTAMGKGVFADTTGKIFRREIQRLNLPPIRFHDLRHTHASLLLSQGVHPKVVQERLGHSSITMTLDTYSHLLPDMQKDAAKGLSDLLFPKHS